MPIDRADTPAGALTDLQYVGRALLPFGKKWLGNTPGGQQYEQARSQSALAAQQNAFQNLMLQHLQKLPPEQWPAVIENYKNVLGVRGLEATAPFVAPQAGANVEATKAGTAHTQAETAGYGQQMQQQKTMFEQQQAPGLQDIFRKQIGMQGPGTVPLPAFEAISGLQHKQAELAQQKDIGQGHLLTSMYPFVSLDPTAGPAFRQRAAELGGVPGNMGAQTGANPVVEALKEIMAQRQAQKQPNAVTRALRVGPHEGLSNAIVNAAQTSNPAWQVMRNAPDLTQLLVQGNAAIPPGVSSEELRTALELLRQLMGYENQTQ